VIRDDDPGRVLGLLLAADWSYVSGVVRSMVYTEDGYAPVVERFWHLGPDRWRIERDDGIAFVSDGQTSATFHRSRLLDAGVPTGVPRASCAAMLYPKEAFVWGRAGDDWQPRLLETTVSDTAITIPLSHVQTGEDGLLRGGFDPSGHLDLLQLGEQRHEIVDLTHVFTDAVAQAFDDAFDPAKRGRSPMMR
jgi:hypothetical protein